MHVVLRGRRVHGVLVGLIHVIFALEGFLVLFILCNLHLLKLNLMSDSLRLPFLEVYVIVVRMLVEHEEIEAFINLLTLKSVILQLVGSVEVFGTLDALVWLAFRMPPFVIYHVSLSSKLPPTVLAFKGLLPCMDS